MTNSQKTLKFFMTTEYKVQNDILSSIAKHYGITQSEAFEEVTDRQAEHLCDYIADQGLRAGTKLLMSKKGLF